jgi:hypothetical protein
MARNLKIVGDHVLTTGRFKPRFVLSYKTPEGLGVRLASAGPFFVFFGRLPNWFVAPQSGAA